MIDHPEDAVDILEEIRDRILKFENACAPSGPHLVDGLQVARVLVQEYISEWRGYGNDSGS